MNTILNKIITHKFKEVEEQKQLVPLDTILLQERIRPHYSLKDKLNNKNSSGIIAEFKRKSPSKGWIHKEAISQDIVSAYEKAGACASSILTDTHFFGGTTADITSLEKNNNIPILRKDFIIDEYQIYEANKIGADIILLIAACLTPARVSQLAKTAKDNGLEVILEIHNEQELKHICDDITFVGVNNRNLHTFQTNLETSVKLGLQIPDKFIKISESGIQNTQNINYLKEHGFRGFLIGETFMKTNDPGKACKLFIDKL